MEEELKKRSGGFAPITPDKSNSKPPAAAGNNGFCDQNDSKTPYTSANSDSKIPKKRKRMKRHAPKIFDETKTKWSAPKPSTPKQSTPERKTKRKYVKKTKPSEDHPVCSKRLDFDEPDIISKNHISLSELAELFLPTEKQRKSAVSYPSLFNCVLNLRPLVRVRKNRSQRSDLLNFITVVRKKRSKISPRCHRIDGLKVQNDKNDLIEKLVSNQGDRNKKPENSFLMSNKILSRQRIIKTCPAKCSLKLIPRDVPPNLEQCSLNPIPCDGPPNLEQDRNVPPNDSVINFVIEKFACLRIGENNSHIVVQDGKVNNAIVKHIVKKRKQWPKVNLDVDMINLNQTGNNSKGKENIENDENDKAEYWAKERGIFTLRAMLFIKYMHAVLGDKHFSKWKGSLVSSIVGVYLTQNVSDFLSSSVYMLLRANYPIVDNKSSQESTTSKAKESTENILLDNYKSSQESTTSKAGESTENTLLDKCRQELTKINDNFMIEEVDFETGLEVAPETDFVESQAEYIVSAEDETVGESKESVMMGKCTPPSSSTKIGDKPGIGKKRDWSELSRMYKNDQATDTIDSIDWEAVRQAPLRELAKVLEPRGQHNIIAERIQDFLNRIVDEHGVIDLEFLRNAPPELTKSYLLDIEGLGLKSVECVRLLSLHQHAFPVDTNVGRILVRLGWIPLKHPLPENVPLHLLNQYPNLDAIQKYIWPRLENIPMPILYELHYHFITAGKIFCTKINPNCNACPLKGECKHFASAYAWSKRHPQTSQGETNKESPTAQSQIKAIPLLEYDVNISKVGHEPRNCEPIVEMPSSPKPIIEMHPSLELKPDERQLLEKDIEDFSSELKDGLPRIIFPHEKFNQAVQSFMEPFGSFQEINELELQFQEEVDMSALVLSNNPATTPKHKDKKRSIYDVYKLPDSHVLLEGFEKREAADIHPYLLLIWKTDDANPSSPTSCDGGTCGSGNSVPCQKFTGTILIPCRTANRGEFPLNGTYFQVNEVFADHETITNPIPVLEHEIQNLNKSLLFCGSSATTICRGMTTQGIQYLYWRGFICVRAFDRASRKPKMLPKRLHTYTSNTSTKM